MEFSGCGVIVGCRVFKKAARTNAPNARLAFNDKPEEPLVIRTLLLASATGIAAALSAGAAFAGPCSAEVMELGHKLSQSPALGPVTTGTLQGSSPKTAPHTDANRPGEPTTKGTSASDKGGGTLGTKEANAAVGNQVATSSQDVRRQQEGLPTAAAAAAASGKGSVETKPELGSSKELSGNMSEAKMALEQARMLDHAGDNSCKSAIERARKLMNG